MKRLSAILFAVALLVALAGCGGTADIQTRPNGTATAQPGPESTAPEHDINITPFSVLRHNYAWAISNGEWYGAEGTGVYTMVEDDGKFVDFNPSSGVWYYDHWENKFYQEH